MSLVGCRYIQSTDPGAAGAGYEWYNTTTGDLYIRNTTNTAWIFVGNGDLATLGSLSRSGGTMSGAIAGVSGWAPLAGPNFSGTPQKASVPLATTTELAALQTSLLASINTQIESAVATYGNKLSISGNIVIGTGELNTQSVAQTIPLPTFAGGRQALEAECKWLASPSYAPMYDHEFDGRNTSIAFVNTSDNIVDPSSTRTLRLKCTMEGSAPYYGNFSYIIIAVKS